MVWRPMALLRGAARRQASPTRPARPRRPRRLGLLMWKLTLSGDGHDTGIRFDPWLFRGGFFLTGLATLMVIAAVTHQRAMMGRLLGNPLFNWVGTRSYGLYLYHWPIYQIIRGQAGVPMTLAGSGSRHGPDPADHRGQLPLHRDADPPGPARRMAARRSPSTHRCGIQATPAPRRGSASSAPRWSASPGSASPWPTTSVSARSSATARPVDESMRTSRSTTVTPTIAPARPHLVGRRRRRTRRLGRRGRSTTVPPSTAPPTTVLQDIPTSRSASRSCSAPSPCSTPAGIKTVAEVSKGPTWELEQLQLAKTSTTSPMVSSSNWVPMERSTREQYEAVLAEVADVPRVVVHDRARHQSDGSPATTRSSAHFRRPTRTSSCSTGRPAPRRSPTTCRTMSTAVSTCSDDTAKQFYRDIILEALGLPT